MEWPIHDFKWVVLANVQHLGLWTIFGYSGHLCASFYEDFFPSLNGGHETLFLGGI